MSKLYRILLMFVLLATATAYSREDLDDNDIQSAINEELLFDDSVRAHLVDVDVNQGIATLSGTVNNLLAKEEAEELASLIKGVRSVVNKLIVQPYHRSDLEIASDVDIALLNDPAADSYEVDVEVKNGKVTLKGTVDSWAERTLAEDVAKAVKGVTGIDNKLKVNYKQDRDDNEIAQDVKRYLENDAEVKVYNLKVDVDDADVSISGVVGSAYEKNEAISDAYMIQGVQSVNADDLTVSWWAKDEMRRKKIPTPKDSEIKQAVNDALIYDPRVLSTDVDVKSNLGVVTLNGEVESLRAKRAAEDDARKTYGVWRVKNHLRVRFEVDVPDTLTKVKVQEAIYRDPFLDRQNISVSVFNNQVYLYGTVDSQFDRDHAETVISNVRGVVSLSNHLGTSKPAADLMDWEIEENVKDQLLWDARVNSNNVNVSANDGRVALTGTVSDWQAYMAAQSNAYEGGAAFVNNDLKIENGPDYLSQTK